MTTVRISGETVALLTRTLHVLQGKVPSERKSLPRWLPDGNPILSLKDLAGVLCIDERTAAFIALDSHNPPTQILAEAKRYARKRREVWHDGVQRKGVVYEQDHHQAAETRQRDDSRGDGRLAGRSLGHAGSSAQGPVTRIIKHRK